MTTPTMSSYNSPTYSYLPPGQETAGNENFEQQYATESQAADIGMQQESQVAEQQVATLRQQLDQDFLQRKQQADQQLAAAQESLAAQASQLQLQFQERKRAADETVVAAQRDLATFRADLEERFMEQKQAVMAQTAAKRRGVAQTRNQTQASAVPPGLRGIGPAMPPGFARGGTVPRYATGGTQPVKVRFNHGPQQWEVFFNGTWRPTTYDQASAWGAAGQAEQIADVNEPDPSVTPPVLGAGVPVSTPPSRYGVRDPRGNAMLPPRRVEAAPPVLGAGVPVSTPQSRGVPAFQPGVDPYPTSTLTPEQSAAIARQLEQSGAYEDAARQRALPPPGAASSFLPPGMAAPAGAPAGPSDEMKTAWAAREKALEDEAKAARQRLGLEDARASGFGTMPAGTWRSYATGGQSPFDRDYSGDPLFTRPTTLPQKPAPRVVLPWEREPYLFGMGVSYLPPVKGWKGYAKGGQTSRMLPPGMEQANGIVGEGLVKGSKTNKRLEVIAEPEAFQYMRFAEGDTAANLTPGSVIMTIHETPQTVRAIKGNIARQEGVPVKKQGGTFVPKRATAGSVKR